ncbi:MAG: DMT family transporter [Rhizobiaceae bacterium]|nr:DMT family transporter [Rhizobiaceae bacterium]
MVTISRTAQKFTPAENLRGGALMALAMAGFGFNDIVIKHISPTLELGQAIFIRGIFATLFIAALAGITGRLRPFRTIFKPALFVRSVAEALATFTFLLALFNIPIANTTAILQALPLMVGLGAAIFFGEKIGWRRLIAILVGFIGVMIIIRPGMEGFNYYSVLVLATVFFATVRDLTTRLIPHNIPSLFVALFTSVSVTIMGGILSIFENWAIVEPITIAWLMLAAGFLVVAYSSIAASMRVGDVGFIVPFRYTILLYAIIAGIVFFDEIPDAMTILGSSIIVATGVYSIYRERIANKNNS